MSLYDLANDVSKGDMNMVLYFIVEILLFFLSGYTLAHNAYIHSIVYLLAGLFLAFVLGEAIRIKERRNING